MADRPLPLLLAQAAALLLACGGAATATGPGEPRAAAPSEPIAQVPFTAAEIRAATPAGRTYVFRFDQGGERRFERYTFERVDDAGFSSASTPVDENGRPVGETRRREGTWEELESHGHFPAERTTIVNAQLTIPLGSFRCRLYAVTSQEDGREVVTRYWFANELPGAPVRMVREVDGEPELEMLVVAHELPIGGS